MELRAAIQKYHKPLLLYHRRGTKGSVSCEMGTIFVPVSTIYDKKRVQKIAFARELLISLVIWRRVSMIFFAVLCYNYNEALTSRSLTFNSNSKIMITCQVKKQLILKTDNNKIKYQHQKLMIAKIILVMRSCSQISYIKHNFDFYLVAHIKDFIVIARLKRNYYIRYNLICMFGTIRNMNHIFNQVQSNTIRSFKYPSEYLRV